MKVYVAMYGYDCGSDTVVGVFSSRQLAQDFLDTHYKTWGDYREVFEYEMDVGV